MKLTKTNNILGVFILIAIIYGYANIVDTVWLIYISKALLTPTMLVYYLVSTKKVNTLFVFALIFIFCENMLVLKGDETFIVLGMGFALLFILMQLLIVTKKIGEIKVGKFFKILIPFLLILLCIIFFIFKNGGEITWIYYVMGIIVAIYGSFSYYLYDKEKNEASLHYLIGTFFFMLSAIVAGLNMIDDRILYLKLLNVIFYVISLVSMSKAIISFDALENPYERKKHL